MEFIIAIIFVVFMIMVDSRLSKIHKELITLNKAVHYLADISASLKK